MQNITIIQLKSIPTDVGQLVSVSEKEGYGFVRRLVDEWLSGTNRFNQAGEVLFGATISESLVGVCGVNCDPYICGESVGRLRHLYVDPDYRCSGVGRMLVSQCVENASKKFHKIRLRTPDTKPNEFYNHLGFNEIDNPSATHEILFIDHDT